MTLSCKQVAVEEYRKLLTDSRFAKAHTKCVNNHKAGLSFESMVIQPIQRIPRFLFYFIFFFLAIIRFFFSFLPPF